MHGQLNAQLVCSKLNALSIPWQRLQPAIVHHRHGTTLDRTCLSTMHIHRYTTTTKRMQRFIRTQGSKSPSGTFDGKSALLDRPYHGHSCNTLLLIRARSWVLAGVCRVLNALQCINSQRRAAVAEGVAATALAGSYQLALVHQPAQRNIRECGLTCGDID